MNLKKYMVCLLAFLASSLLCGCGDDTDTYGDGFVNYLEDVNWYLEDKFGDLSENDYHSYIMYSRGKIIRGDYAADEIYEIGTYHVSLDDYMTCEYYDGSTVVFFIQEVTSTNLVLRREDEQGIYSYAYYVRE